MDDGSTLQPKSTGQQRLPCPEMKWKSLTAYRDSQHQNCC